MTPLTLGRRAFLAALGGVCVVDVTRSHSRPGGLAFGAQDGSAPFRIDTHHHVFPPPYIAALAAQTLDDQIGASWSVARTLDDMERAGVATAVLSVTTPAVTFAEPPVARRVARECNEWVADLVAGSGGRFGSFATVPLPDVDGTLLEIEHALDVLNADGICLLTSYGDRWLGHPDFAPVMDELNRRRAVVYTHPATADCCRNLLPDVPPTVIEFGTDTSRTITDIVFSGTAARCPDAQFIFSHAGGTLPYLTERLVRMPIQNPALRARVPNGVLAELTRFYYDTAWSAHPMAMASLTKLVDVSRILFGSDYPYRTGADHVQGLIEYGFSDADRRAIERENALRLLPRLRA
jgi:predicted TIM-barrel fold metal-dependent hydrolase